MRAPRCPSILTTLQVGFGDMCIYTLRQKGIRREYCGVRGANVEEVGATDIEETKLPTPVLRIYEVSVVPCPQLRPTIVASSRATFPTDHPKGFPAKGPALLNSPPPRGLVGTRAEVPKVSAALGTKNASVH